MRIAVLCLLLALLPGAETTVTQAWSRATLAGAEAGALYATITGGDAGDRLLSAESAAAKVVEVHEHAKGADGVMQMRAVQGGIAIPAGGSVALKPGSYHIMLIGLTAPLVKGTRLPAVLVFERAGRISVEAEIREPWAMAFDE